LLDKKLLEILVCPQCKGGLGPTDGGKALLCDSCQLKYPVREDVPVLLVSEAVDLRKSSAKIHPEMANLPKVEFQVTAGPDKGMKFSLERGTCRAIGRGEAQTDRTMIFNVDIALSIDESTKAIILRYIEKQFRKSIKPSLRKEGKEQFGFFQRVADVVLTDQSLSRLHAMFFADETSIGVLDLVSKNGTFVNGAEVESQLLKKGDVVEMGETKIVYGG
jgi:uncharacterized protein YbaR (Trm112 family)